MAPLWIHSVAHNLLEFAAAKYDCQDHLEDTSRCIDRWMRKILYYLLTFNVLSFRRTDCDDDICENILLGLLRHL